LTKSKGSDILIPKEASKNYDGKGNKSMHRALLPFEFFEPKTVDEALRLLDTANSKVMAGGVDLVLKMRLRLILPDAVIALQRIPGLDYIESNPAGLRFGALASIRQIELSPLVQKNWRVLFEAVHQITSVQTKTMGTVVGNLCVATPTSDIAPPLFVLGAKVKIVGLSYEKVIPIENFFVAVGKTILEPNEIVTEIFVPGMPARTGSAFLKAGKTAGDIAKVNAAVMVFVTDKICKDARIALGSVGPTPIRVPEAEEVLKGHKLDEAMFAEAAEAAADAVKPISDIRSTAKYRKEMVRVLVKDALAKAAVNVKA
jgi:CO/xanthine dehydrogenase FAD-binding subunit